MAKKATTTKKLSAKKIEAEVGRILKGVPPLLDVLADGPFLVPKPATSGGVIVVRDFVTYSAYDDPIEG